MVIKMPVADASCIASRHATWWFSPGDVVLIAVDWDM
jgi:hypothetical protein